MAELAQALVFHCFREPLENLHEGTFPDTQAGDYSDVKVVTPYGEIPWNHLARISDDEMRALVIEVVNQTFTTLASIDNPRFMDGFLAFASETKLLWKRPAFKEAFVKAMESYARPHPEDSGLRS